MSSAVFQCSLDTWHWSMGHQRLDLGALDTPYPFLLAIPQARTEALLEERALGLGVTIKRGYAVTAVLQDDDQVTIDADGRPMTAAYLVGCDGAGSLVRKAAGIGFEGTDATVVGLIADAVLDDPPPPGSPRSTRPGWPPRTGRGGCCWRGTPHTSTSRPAGPG